MLANSDAPTKALERSVWRFGFQESKRADEVVDEFCGTHSVVSFNSARDRLGQRFRGAGYLTTRTWVGNTLGFQQPCAGPVVRSDGYVDRVRT